MDHVQVRTTRGATLKSNPQKMACEKASRRLKSLLVKASRVGVTTADVARLPSARKLVPKRDHGWKLGVFFVLMLGGALVVALICTSRRGCSRIEDINLAT